MAAAIDRSTRDRIRLRGPDAAEFLQGQVTNDVEGLAPGEGCYAALLTHKGKMRLDMRVLRGADWLWLDTEPGGAGLLSRTVDTYGLGRQVSWEPADERIVSVVGEDADEALDARLPDTEHSWVEGRHGMYVRTWAGIDVIGPDVRLDLPELTEEEHECLRIERGIPRFGIDMDADTIPQEAGINDRAVSFTKGCYVGQETVARLHYRGKPNRHLRGLRLDAPAAPGQAVTLGDRQVGTIGSACVSPRHGPIALAIIRREAEPDSAVQVEGNPAKVVELPFPAA